MSEEKLWEQRYQFALEAQQKIEREHKAQVQLLTRAIVRLSGACEGQDRSLDAELESLRGFLKLKTLSTDVLASKLDVVEEKLRALAKSARSGDPRVQAAVQRMLETCTARSPPRDGARALETLRKELRAGTDPAALIERAMELQAQLLEGTARAAAAASVTVADEAGAASLQSTRTTAAREARPGLLQRLFGSRQRKPPAPATDRVDEERSGAETDPVDIVFEPVSEPASRALDALIDTVQAPPAEPDLHRVYGTAKARAARGVRARELVSAIDEVRVLTGAALARARDEFGHFLHRMNERLARSTAILASGAAQVQARAASIDAMQASMQAGIRGLRDEVSAARDLEQLKREVAARVDGIDGALVEFRERETRQAREAAAEARALAERVVELQQQATHAERRIDEQRQLALTDPLTQLPNREAWTQRLAEEQERARRYGRELSLAVCDVDRFKAVNDRHGHAGGDAVLEAVATCLRGALRDADFVARYGGEEFVILLPETDSLQAAQALENVRRDIAALPITCAGIELRVTASFGVASFGAGDDSERVFARADSALYRAKSSGRDRVAVYSDQDGERR